MAMKNQSPILIENAGFSLEVSAILRKRGFNSLEDLRIRSASEIMALRGISRKRLAEIERILARRGLSLANRLDGRRHDT
jgi:DNA-directed RNA polymerase alpha subunit